MFLIEKEQGWEERCCSADFFFVVVGRLGERRGRGGFELFCIYKGLEGERNRLVLLEVRESQTQKWLLVLLRQRFDSNC